MGQRRFDVVLFLLFGALLAGCGGGRTMLTSSQLVLPPATTPAPAGGPVTYMQGTGSTASGAIVAGTHQALIAVISGATAASTAFSSDALTVDSGSAVAVSPSSVALRLPADRPARLAPVEAFAADDHRLLAKLEGLYAAASGSKTPQAAVRAQAFALGASRLVWVQKGALSGGRVNVQIPATLAYQSAHINVWVDSTLQFTQAQLAQIDADAENAYTSDTAHFASPDYASGAPGLQPRYSACAPGGASQGTTAAYVQEPADHRIDVMVVNSSNLGGLGGYFSAANLMTQATLNCLNGSSSTYESNEAPFIFVGWFAGSGATYDLQEDLVRSTAHELQHLINFVNHGILAPGASSASFNGYEQTYINEGLSMLAQDLAVQQMYGSSGVQFDVDDALSRANVYLSSPSNYSLSGFSGIDPAAWGGSGSAQYNCGGGCYGGAYLFQRYLHDRFGGDAYTHAIETSGVTESQNLRSVTGESSASLFGDFALAMAADDLQVASTDPRFSFGSLQVAGIYSDQFGATMRLGGLYAVPLSGGAVKVAAPIGGFAFVDLSSVPAAGTPIAVTDTATAAGFSLEGGFAQK